MMNIPTFSYDKKEQEVLDAMFPEEGQEDIRQGYLDCYKPIIRQVTIDNIQETPERISALIAERIHQQLRKAL